MEIRRLRLSGFKSFVEPAELRIEPGLTGVVGPNGCGKSNLLEAIRWVMGETSAKSMRSGGMEDVIFAGTEARPPRQFAEVVLTGSDDSGDELEVVRRIERGAGSAYRVNGNDVRAKDVALAFADAATGAHSPALVSQGKIAHMIAAKPAERRQMLEEAAGIAGLHVRRKDAESKLRSTEKNLERLEDLLAGLDTQIASLRRQAKQAERYARLTDEIGVAEARLVFARWRDAAASAEAARKAASEATQAVAQAKERSDETEKAQRAAAEKLADARDALVAARTDAGAQEQRLAGLEKERDAALARLADLDRQAERLEQDREDYGRTGRDAADALKRLESELAASEKARDEAEAALPQIIADAERAEQAERAAELDLARANAEHAALDAEWRVARAALEQTERRVAGLAREAERLEESARQQAGADDPAELLETAQRNVKEAAARRQALAARIATAREARDSARVEMEAAQAALAEARAELAGVEREHAALERDRHGRDKARAAKAGLPVPLDRVRAEPGYEAALAAVLGRDGRSPLGLLPDAQDGRFWTGAPQPEPVADNLLDHVKDCPEELHARLARVVVAESDDARTLEPGTWLVTLGGALRRWDGLVVRGEGGAEAARLEAANRLAALAERLPPLQRAVEEAEGRSAAARTALDAAQADFSRAEGEADSAAQAEREALRALDRAEAALASHADKARAIEQAREELADQRATAERELEAAQAKLADLTDPEALASRRDAARSAHETARTNLSAATAARAAQEQALAVAKERVSAHRADRTHWDRRADEAARRLADMDSRVAEIATARETIGDQPDALLAQIEAARTAHEETAARLAALQATLDEAQAAADAADAAQRSANETLAEARERRAQAETRAENEDARRSEMARVSGDRFHKPPPLLPATFEFDENDVADREAEAEALEKLTSARERIGPVNLVAADELAKIEEEHGSTAAEREELTEAVHRLRGSIGQLNREGRERLKAAFEQVDAHFQKLFARLFEGGQAHLALIDSDDVLEAGLEIYAQPPGKRLQSLTLLSGGEQALTAIALTFALFLTNPAPICVLDEVDAPLDDANIDRFCDLLEAMTQETSTRYLIVTHNAVTMSRMHRLFGVTMIEKGVSRLVSVDLQAAELLAAE
ncbi:AAA family ATPase [Alteriqipengyuania lutimaris]|uniref:Chromosome partition protein Smc n=1 Tax=Alteriqipengyuania lutimaris TaxID=1538146 RepID=A0A395LKV8_9SPHN|nr:AAA family ATPase [Alteriqipengyuania lutimaris]MBB3035489.1 chromosome segregation protein [Alteriqipengyuania lutimaris]RDS76054.1 chromosome segregation protein [Alteriqipengyuania lutimaris]